MEYFGYIFASYFATALVLSVLVGWVVLDQRARQKELADLESQGIRRRSVRGSPSQ